ISIPCSEGYLMMNAEDILYFESEGSYTNIFTTENKKILTSKNLKEVEVMLKSEAVLAVSPKIDAERQVILDKLLFRIQAVLKGRDYKYVLLNAPNERLDDIVKMLPGMKSPTVLPLAEKGWSSVHSVIDKQAFWEVIDNLKDAGAQGILVSDIEKMVL
ncbi:MAG: LytTR family transcriptional regulator DNA-binding domain-containing protein, partial [Leeuwenhoekiella sp.]|nr:LytTR family transcriptional regulator DNA-binding domain-containing protein [Leeuwenhoekiella sp.]